MSLAVRVGLVAVMWWMLMLMLMLMVTSCKARRAWKIFAIELPVAS